MKFIVKNKEEILKIIGKSTDCYITKAKEHKDNKKELYYYGIADGLNKVYHSIDDNNITQKDLLE